MSSPDFSPPRHDRSGRHDPRARALRSAQPDASLPIARPRHTHSHNTRSKQTHYRPIGREIPQRPSSRLHGRGRGIKGGAAPPAAAYNPTVQPAETQGKGLKAGWMRRWNNGRAFYDSTYINFNQVYNLVELLYTSVVMPDGRFSGPANITTLAASGWLMYRKVLKEWLGNLKTTRYRKSTVLWYAFTMFTVLIAAIRGNRDKGVRAGLGLFEETPQEHARRRQENGLS